MATAIILCVLGILSIGLLLFWLQKSQEKSVRDGFRFMQDSFEGLQRHLLLSQKEFERNYEAKSGSLRGEILETLQANRQELQVGLHQTTQALENKVGGMDQKLDTRLQELSQNVSSRLELNLKEGFLHFEKIQEHLKGAERQLLDLNRVGQSVQDLNNLLKLPHLRGGFGEAILEQILADLLPKSSYELQYRIVPNSTERVDAVVRYPNYLLPIDSKFPKEQVLPLFETNDPQILESARKQLIEVMKTLARQIKEKYIRPEHGTAEMALLFVPSETLYFEVLRNTRLCDDLAKLKVFLVSPNTLAVTLHSIAIAQNYYEMAKGVEKTILEIRKAQQHFANFEGRFDEVGVALQKAQNAFNTATTHLGRYQSAVVRLSGDIADLEVKGVPVSNPTPSLPS